ncbi:MAG: hypothetical protein JSW00_16745 [Thermoplasmata archaeon]|nr:MAG: hypothetical protein JSW00_16745 [Thermoplasmata archaeon]
MTENKGVVRPEQRVGKVKGQFRISKKYENSDGERSEALKGEDLKRAERDNGFRVWV